MEPLSWAEILGRIFVQFTPVWIALVVVFAVSIWFKRNLGLYGKLFDSTIDSQLLNGFGHRTEARESGLKGERCGHGRFLIEHSENTFPLIA